MGPKNWWASLSREERDAFCERLSQAQKKRWREKPELHSRVGEKVSAAWTPERRERMSKAATRENNRRVMRSEHPFSSKENKELTGRLSREFWNTPGKEEEKERIKGDIVRKVLSSRDKTSPEISLEGLLDELFPGEFRFNNGWFVLGGKVPDFVNVNGKKLLVEMFG